MTAIPRPGTMRWMGVGLLCCLVLASGCSIQPDTSPRDVNPDQSDPVDAGIATVTEAGGDANIFLVSPTEPGQQRRLRSVQRGALDTPTEILETLLEGATQSELDNRFVSAIPAETTLRSARRAGPVLFVDISRNIDELTDEALALAVAQIVFTVSELPEVQQVRLRVEGEDRSWPRGDGQSRPGDLRTFDFPGLVETSQPPFPGVGAEV